MKKIGGWTIALFILALLCLYMFYDQLESYISNSERTCTHENYETSDSIITCFQTAGDLNLSFRINLVASVLLIGLTILSWRIDQS